MTSLRPASAFLLVALALPLEAAPLLRNPLPVPMGTENVSDILQADFNGDHHDDVLIVNAGKEISVLLDNGTGPFAAPVVSPAPNATGRPAVGDVNGDGKNDLVVANESTGTIEVMFGNGDGSFTAGPSFNGGGSAGPLVLADFNGDHILDVAVGGGVLPNSSNGVTVYFGDGTGHFSGGITTTAFDQIRSLTTADLNGDGRPDLIVADSQGTHVLIGNGNGTFTPKLVAGFGVSAIGDFNHDGKLDLVVVRGSTPDSIEVDLGNGDGTFTKSMQPVPGYAPLSLVVADVDGDGNLDLVGAGWPASDMMLLRGKGDGTFHSPELFVAGPGAYKILASDFDRDGKVDFLTADYNRTGPWLSFVRGNGDGSFQANRLFHAGSAAAYGQSTATGAVVADMNHDGKPDVIVMQEQSTPAAFDLAVMLNDGTGKVAAPILTTTSIDAFNGPVLFALADVNHDGNLDAVVLWYGSGTHSGTLLGRGDGTFGPLIPFAGGPGKPFLADFDGDGTPDLIIHSGGLSLLHGNGDGTFGPAVVLSSEYYSSDILVGDLNGDGAPDYVNSELGSMAAYVNDGHGHFTSRPIAAYALTAIALADFNGDGKLDLLIRTDTGLQTRFGNGDGTFGAPVAFTLLPQFGDSLFPPGFVATADFDGDGRIDVAQGTTIYFGNGDGTFRSQASLRTNDASWLSAADMDGNGSPDLVYLTPGDDVAIILTRMTADPTARPAITLSSDTSAPEYAQYVKFTATVVSGSTVPLTGAVFFAVGGQNVATVRIGKDGKAVFETPFLVGSYEVAATYTGDENYLSSTTSLPLSIAKAHTSLTLEYNPNSEPYGEDILIRVYVDPGVAPGFPPPTGALTLRDGNTPLNVHFVNRGFLIHYLGVGTHVLSVDFAGDANFEPATASFTQVITKPLAILDVRTPPGDLIAGTLITLHAYFGNLAAGVPIAGTIDFYENGGLIASAPVAHGSADISRSFAVGPHNIEARYSGDSFWASSNFFLYFTVVPATRRRLVR